MTGFCEDHGRYSGDWCRACDRDMHYAAGYQDACNERGAESEEIDRLRDIIGRLYVQRGAEPHELRNAIRRAFREANPSASFDSPKENA